MIGIFWCRVWILDPIGDCWGMCANVVADIWFHRYRDGRDIEGRCEFDV